MAYDAGLAQRIEEYFGERLDVEKKTMFGGVCYMLTQHMCCGVVGDMLLARVGPKQYEACLALPHAKEMDFTGKPLTGMVYVCPLGYASDAQLAGWLARCETFVASLPPKPPKPTGANNRTRKKENMPVGEA